MTPAEFNKEYYSSTENDVPLEEILSEYEDPKTDIERLREQLQKFGGRWWHVQALYKVVGASTRVEQSNIRGKLYTLVEQKYIEKHPVDKGKYRLINPQIQEIKVNFNNDIDNYDIMLPALYRKPTLKNTKVHVNFFSNICFC